MSFCVYAVPRRAFVRAVAVCSAALRGGLRRERLAVLLVAVLLVVSANVASLAVSAFATDSSSRLADGEFTDRQLDELTALLKRVQLYEQQLKLKSFQIDAAIREASELNFGLLSNAAKSASDAKQLGIGGGDSPKSPIISHRAAPTLHGRLAGDRKILERVANQLDAFRRIPIGYPVDGLISSPFGRRSSPFSRRTDMHTGIDIAVDKQSSVVAVADGLVVYAGYKGAYGNMVLIDHGNGYETLYGHLSKALAKVGEKICRGEQLGLVGTTGRTTGPHLHFEVRLNGRPKDPLPFVELAAVLGNL